MLKRILSAILVIVTLFTSIAVMGADFKADAASDTMKKLNELIVKFPHGKYWNHMGGTNNPDKVTSKPCDNHSRCDWNVNACNCNSYDNAIQCMGYAHKVAYEIVGSSPRHTFTKSTTLDVSKLRVGDVIRYRWNGHSICVTGVKGTKISFTDCNWIGKCQIRWDVMDVSEIKKTGFTYVLHHKDNNRKNTDLYFFQKAESANVELESETASELWQMMPDANLNIRSTRSVNANVVGKISGGDKFKVYDKHYDGTYLWGKILVDGTLGWCALNYSEYISGSIEKPDVTNAKASYEAATKFTLKWKEVPGASKYVLYIYNDKKEVVKKYSTAETKKTITLNEKGKYTAKVVASNELAASWKMTGKTISFTIADKIVKTTSVKLSKTAETVAIGSSYTLKATVSPSNATVKTVSYTTSDKNVATVSSSGKITAKGIGTAVITVKTSDGGASAKCKITVVPAKVTIKQTGSASGSATISWNKVSGASKYIIYKYNKTNDKYEKLATVKTNTYKFTLASNKSVKVKIKAVGYKDDVSYTGSASAAFTAYSGPSVPVMLLKAGTKSAKLSWTKVNGADGYMIYIYENGESVKIATLKSADTLSYTMKELTSGKSYSFRMRAYKKVANTTIYGSYTSKATVKVK